MKQNKLGTAFKFSEPDTIHINREAWDERTYSFNSWNDKHILSGVDWDKLHYQTLKDKKTNKKELFTLILFIGIILSLIFILG